MAISPMTSKYALALKGFLQKKPKPAAPGQGAMTGGQAMAGGVLSGQRVTAAPASQPMTSNLTGGNMIPKQTANSTDPMADAMAKLKQGGSVPGATTMPGGQPDVMKPVTDAIGKGEVVPGATYMPGGQPDVMAPVMDKIKNGEPVPGAVYMPQPSEGNAPPETDPWLESLKKRQAARQPWQG